MPDPKQNIGDLLEGQGAEATLKNLAVAKEIARRGQSSAATSSNYHQAQTSANQSQSQNNSQSQGQK